MIKGSGGGGNEKIELWSKNSTREEGERETGIVVGVVKTRVRGSIFSRTKKWNICLAAKKQGSVLLKALLDHYLTCDCLRVGTNDVVTSSCDSPSLSEYSGHFVAVETP